MIKPERLERVAVRIVRTRAITLNNSKKNNDDEKEEGYIEHDSIQLQRIAIRGFQFVTDTTTSTNTRVQMKFEALSNENGDEVDRHG